jgi:hypothetical protein
VLGKVRYCLLILYLPVPAFNHVSVIILCGDDDKVSALLRLRLMMHKTILWLNFFD